MFNQQIHNDGISDQSVKQRNSGITSASQNQNEAQLTIQNEVVAENFENRFYRVRNFTVAQNKLHKKISPKVNRSAVNWIQTNCWVKNLDYETTTLAIIFYYGYYAKFALDKTKLELILSACIYFAKKYASSPQMSLDCALSMISGNFSKKHIKEIEQDLFQMVKGQCYFQNNTHYLGDRQLNEEQQNKVKFLIEILLLKDSEVLYNEQILEALIKIVRNVQTEEILTSIPQLLISKQSKTLINKYKSCFEVDAFVSEILQSALNNDSEARNSV